MLLCSWGNGIPLRMSHNCGINILHLSSFEWLASQQVKRSIGQTRWHNLKSTKGGGGQANHPKDTNDLCYSNNQCGYTVYPVWCSSFAVFVLHDSLHSKPMLSSTKHYWFTSWSFFRKRAKYTRKIRHALSVGYVKLYTTIGQTKTYWSCFPDKSKLTHEY